MNTARRGFAGFRQSSSASGAVIRSKRGPLLYAATLCALLFAAGAASESAVAAERTLEGSWIVHVIPDPETGIPPFVNLASFTKDGRAFNSDPTEGAALGEWIRIGDHKFASTFMGFTNLGRGPLLNKVRAEGEVGPTGNTFEGPFIAEVFNEDGSVALSITGTGSGTRIVLERLP